MLAEAEGKVGIRLTIQANVLGRFENPLIKIGRGPTQRDSASGLDEQPVNLRVQRADPTDMSQWHEHAEKFLAGVNDAFWVLAEVFEGIRVSAKIMDN